MLKATIEWRVSEDDQAGESGSSFVCVCVSVFGHKHEKSASLYVPLTASLWCLRVSVCPSLPVCVCLCLSLCPSFSVCLCRPVGLSVSRTASLSVCRSFCLSVCLGLVLVAKKCLLVCVSVPAIPGPLTTTQSKEKAPWMTMDDEASDENNI